MTVWRQSWCSVRRSFDRVWRQNLMDFGGEIVWNVKKMLQGEKLNGVWREALMKL